MMRVGRVMALGVLAMALVMAMTAGCAAVTEGSSAAPSSAASGVAVGAPPAGELAALVIDDGPPPAGYLRDLFPTWKDIDGDGCDARRQALVAASATPAVVGARCAVISGAWTSDYDGKRSTVPTEVQIDHVVPLADAWRSGADGWATDERTMFANDQGELWAVSASSNQSKGDSGPDEWRPPNGAIWCRYAQRWLDVKLRWHLTATTPERDALGQMLETC